MAVTKFLVKANGPIVSNSPTMGAKKRVLARAISYGLARSVPIFALAGGISFSTAAIFAADISTQTGTVYVFGYAAGVLSDDFSVVVEGKKFAANKGAIKIDAPIGTHTLQVYRGADLAFAIPIYFDAEFKRSLLLTLDKPGSLDYSLQDSATAEVLDAGSKILPGMEASVEGSVIIEPAEGSGGTAKPLANALVRLENTDQYAVTDAQGKFKFTDLAAGQYTLVFVAPENFDPIAPISFTLAPKESAERAVSIAEILETLSEIKVTATGVSQQTQATEEERSSSQVAEVINAEQMKRGGDSEASGALKRVTGLSVVGGKFIYVRGMGERYSSVLLNGAQIPSPDPTRRVVPLDLFPTEVLDSVVVQKSYSADMPGEFGGGTVMLRTKEAGRKPFFKISAGISAVDGTSFASGLRHDGGKRDWLGFDRVRELPVEVLSLTDGRPIPQNTPPAQLEAAGEALARIGFDTRRENIGPNGNFSASGGTGFEFDNGMRFGLLGAVRNTHGWDTRAESRRRYGRSNAGIFVTSEIERAATERQSDLTGFLNGSLRFDSNHKLQFTSMVLRQSSDQTQVDAGYTDTPNELVQNYELEWIENSLISNQLSGEHLFSTLGDLNLNWQVTDARAGRDSPAKRQYVYLLNGGEYRLSLGSDGNQTIYEKLNDASREYRLGLSIPWAMSDESFFTFTSGLGRVERDRESSLRRFVFSARSAAVLGPEIGRLRPDQIFSPQNIGPNGFQLAEITRTLDNYIASQALNSLFLNVDWSFGEHWRVVGGVRREDNDQQVSTFDIATPATGRIEAGSKLAKWLPALGATYIFDESQQQIRSSFGRSVSRPDFREYSPAPFTDPILDIESSGNPLLVPTQIDNFDLRWERYFDGEESIAAGLFYKQFDLPIERVTVPGTGGLLSYENAERATNVGVELEGFLRLGRFNPALDNFFVSANLSGIKSKVELGSAAAVQTSRTRPLQGQSKYLANVQFGYKPESGPWEATGLYNVAGRRISQVGAFGFADVYEEPFHQLDLTARYRFASEWTFGVRLKNLLDETVEFTQSGLPTRLYKPGREIGFSIEWAPIFDALQARGIGE